MSNGIIDVKAASKLRGFRFKNFSHLKGTRAGIHKSIFPGISPDFLEYKEYSEGDDLKYLDWRLYGRADRLYVKQFEDEVNTNWFLYIDTSGSMDYGSNEITKLDFAKKLCATFAYLLLKQGDAVGLIFVNNQHIELIPPKSDISLITIINEKLNSLKAGGMTNLKEPILNAIQKLRTNGPIVIISDMLIDLTTIEETIKLIRSAKKDAIVFHTLDKNEIEFNFEGSIEFEDMEDSSKVLVEAKDIRKNYLRRLDDFLNKISLVCFENKIRYVISPTHSSIEDILIQVAVK